MSQTILVTRVAKVSKSQVIESVGTEFSEEITKGPSSSGQIVLNHFIPEISRSMGLRWLPRRRGAKATAYRELSYELSTFEWKLQEHLDNIEFIGPFRNNPLRVYPFSGETPSTVGLHGDNAVGILVSSQYLQRRHKRKLLNLISQWFEKSGIAKEIQVVPISERYFEVRIKHVVSGESANIADAGYGCSQILPILVAGYNSDINKALVIAQPEIHLHPKAEAEVGTFLCEIAKRNIQLFIETHGVHLMLRLQSHIAAGDISPEDVNVVCVFPEEGKKNYRRIPIGRDGFFSEEWPNKGFFPERLEEAKRLAKFSA